MMQRWGQQQKQRGNADHRDNRNQDQTRIANSSGRDDGHENHKDNGPDGENGEYSKDREDQERGGEGKYTGRPTAGTGMTGHR